MFAKIERNGNMSETKKKRPPELTLGQAMAGTFAKNPKVKEYYDEMEPEYQLKKVTAFK